MTTEQYSIGYEAGYQDGFDAALAQPVKQEPVVCPDCNGSGEMETGIGMFPCDSCHGSCVKDSLTVQAAVLAERELRAELLASLIKAMDEAAGWLDDSTGHTFDGEEWYEKAKVVITKATEIQNGQN